MRGSGDKPRKGKPLSVDLHALRGITKSERLGKERTRCGVGGHIENRRVDLELRGRPRLRRHGVRGGWGRDGRRRWSLGVEVGAIHCGGGHRIIPPPPERLHPERQDQ